MGRGAEKGLERDPPLGGSRGLRGSPEGPGMPRGGDLEFYRSPEWLNAMAEFLRALVLICKIRIMTGKDCREDYGRDAVLRACHREDCNEGISPPELKSVRRLWPEIKDKDLVRGLKGLQRGNNSAIPRVFRRRKNSLRVLW